MAARNTAGAMRGLLAALLAPLLLAVLGVWGCGTKNDEPKVPDVAVARPFSVDDPATWTTVESTMWGFKARIPPIEGDGKAALEAGTYLNLISRPLPVREGPWFMISAQPTTYAQARNAQSSLDAMAEESVRKHLAHTVSCDAGRPATLYGNPGLTVSCKATSAIAPEWLISARVVATPNRIFVLQLRRPGSWPSGAELDKAFFDGFTLTAGSVKPADATTADKAGDAITAGKYEEACSHLVSSGFSPVVCEWTVAKIRGANDARLSGDQLERFLRAQHVRRVSGQIVGWYDEAANQYEVRVGGRVAILEASETTFETTGRFTMWAQNAYKMDETLESGREVSVAVYREWPLFAAITDVLRANAESAPEAARSLLREAVRGWWVEYCYQGDDSMGLGDCVVDSAPAKKP